LPFRRFRDPRQTCCSGPGEASPAPAQLSAGTAKLLQRRATDGMRSATALADTFGTEAFVELAITAAVPPDFVEHASKDFPALSIDLPAGADRDSHPLTLVTNIRPLSLAYYTGRRLSAPCDGYSNIQNIIIPDCLMVPEVRARLSPHSNPTSAAAPLQQRSPRLPRVSAAPCCAGAKAFDIFKTWRMDSGTYETEAAHVIRGWTRRCAERASLVAGVLLTQLHLHLR